MPKAKQLTQDAVPTTSLADMMFLLLIFFIMTTTLVRQTGFTSDMPSGSKSSQSQAAEKSTVIALVNDAVKVNDADMSYEAMEKFLKDLNLPEKQGNAKIVILSTSGNVSYQSYFQTMALIQACGGVVAIETEETNK